MFSTQILVMIVGVFALAVLVAVATYIIYTVIQTHNDIDRWFDDDGFDVHP